MARNVMGGMFGVFNGQPQENQPTIQNQQINVDAGGWKCECGTENTGKFCQNCGSKKLKGLRFINAINADGLPKI